MISFDWASDPAPSQPASTQTVTCHLSKGLTDLELVEAVEAVRDDQAADSRGGSAHWPGDKHGLTPREAAVLDLIARGLSTEEIANAAYLSINSVKVPTFGPPIANQA